MTIGDSTAVWTGGSWQATATADYPDVSNVLDGIAYGDGAYTGTLTILSRDPWADDGIVEDDRRRMINDEKAAWWQDHIHNGQPVVYVHTLTVSGGDVWRGSAPTEAFVHKYTHNCSLRRPRQIEVEQGYMDPNDRSCAFYLDLEASPAQVAPEESDRVITILQGVSENYKITDLSYIADSGRCQLFLSPLTEQEATAYSG